MYTCITHTHISSLVSDRHIHANSEYLRLHEEKAKSGDKKVEVAVITGENYMKEKRVKKEPADEEPGPSGIGAAPSFSVLDDALLLPRQQVEGHDDEIVQALQNQLDKSNEMDTQSAVSESESPIPASSTGTPVPESVSAPLTSQSPIPDSKGIVFAVYT